MKRLTTNDILDQLLARLPRGTHATVSEHVLSDDTVCIALDWPRGGVTLFLSPNDLRVPAIAFALRWIVPALDGAVPAAEPLICLSCGAKKRPGIDLPCGH